MSVPGREVRLLLFATLFLLPASAEFALAHEEPEVVNTEKSEKDFLPPEESLARMKAPPGFNITQFAAEPEVRQPIAMELDDRGRLWIAECYSYPTWKAEGNDRLLIFEDTNGDGRFDTRTVFWDKGNYLSGFALGFGGVFVAGAPNLLFIPDRDGDDVPDGEPEVLLDGWGTKGVHNVFNAFTWGPDGWLYGAHGITGPSKVGKPGAAEAERVALDCAIWRYHPVRREFEVVCRGTTNPWGIDFDAHGQGFFTNCVIAHLWHIVPGAYYKRMFGSHENPYVYELLDTTADHLHWAGGEWTTSRGGQGAHGEAGGGHAHSGAMIYLGDNWPEEYRGGIFTCNIHGTRVNHDRLARRGSGYTGTHADDFLFANDSWFRGLELKYGPDGAVYIIDWYDTGECHDREAHRTSGRIYKVAYGKPAAVKVDLQAASDLQLAEYQRHANEWYVRHARRVIQERAAAGKELAADARGSLEKLLTSENEIERLRALWALDAAGLATGEMIRGLLGDPSEHVRWWAIRLLSQQEPNAELRAEFVKLAAEEDSALVRLGLASAVQELPLAERWPLVEALAAREVDAEDANLPLMLWYGIEPAVPQDRTRALALAAKGKIPALRRLIARRLAEAQ